jgi:hypothetical protein
LIFLLEALWVKVTLWLGGCLERIGGSMSFLCAIPMCFGNWDSRPALVSGSERRLSVAIDDNCWGCWAWYHCLGERREGFIVSAGLGALAD